MSCPCKNYNTYNGKCSWCNEAIAHNMPPSKHSCATGRSCT